MATPRVILECAPYHSRLLNSIAELDYVPSALNQQTDHLKELELQRKESEQKLKKLSEITKNLEPKGREDPRDSTAAWRLAHKFTGRKEKFKERDSNKEELYRYVSTNLS